MDDKNKKSDKSNQGRKNRVAGARFEAKVRAKLEREGWIVDRWTNTTEFKEGKGRLIPCKPKFNPYTKRLMMNTGGFPDFIAIKKNSKEMYEVIGIECKSNGYLTKVEKEKAKWLVESCTFGKMIIAKKGKKRGEVVYK